MSEEPKPEPWNKDLQRLKDDLESERKEREREAASKKLEQSLEWTKRFSSAVVGAAIASVLCIVLSECSDMQKRLTTLEQKK
jgi:hypothetical protein